MTAISKQDTLTDSQNPRIFSPGVFLRLALNRSLFFPGVDVEV